MNYLIPLFVAASTGPTLVRKTARPPNFETPIVALDQQFTPNEQFFVRSHLSGIPKVDGKTWTLDIGGDAVAKPLKFSLADLQNPKEFEQVELAAVAVCSGNRRGLFDPHVPGVQWGHGAMGNAVWKGVRLRDVLTRAGVKNDALEIIFDGADVPVNEKTPDYRKAIPLTKAMDPDTLIAFSMNGKPLPEAQGFPARIVVPGWTATYWVKQLVSVQASRQPFDGFWTKTAYRIPKGKFPSLETPWPSQATDVNTPITSIAVNSLMTRPTVEKSYKKGERVEIAGFAWDGGLGIAKVEVSHDGGKTWTLATLERDYGKYSWRRFGYSFIAAADGPVQGLSRATNLGGQTQASEVIANGPGYHHNVPQGIQSATAPKDSSGDEMKLKPGPGKDQVATACGMCHSLDYIEMQAQFLDRKAWEAVVTKMVNVYGAPVAPADQPAILDYLAKNYGH